MVCAGETLESEWAKLTGGNGTLGVAMLHLESGRSAGLNASERFPLASVCKLPLAMHMLALVDEGRFRRDQLIDIPAGDVAAWVSPIAEQWPAKRAWPLDRMLELMVAESDNTAVDCLFRVGGGKAAMDARFRRWRITGMRLDRTEGLAGFETMGYKDLPPQETWTREKRLAWARQAPAETRREAMKAFLADPRDTGTPDSAIQLLSRLYRGELLSKASTAEMIRILQATRTAPNRLCGKLPQGTVVGHKTGTTATADGLNGSTNAIGVIELPAGKGRLAIAVFFKGSTLSDQARDGVIAQAVRQAYEDCLA